MEELTTENTEKDKINVGAGLSRDCTEEETLAKHAKNAKAGEDEPRITRMSTDMRRLGAPIRNEELGMERQNKRRSGFIPRLLRNAKA